MSWQEVCRRQGKALDGFLTFCSRPCCAHVSSVLVSGCRLLLAFSAVPQACANAILSAGMASTMVFADVDQKKVKGEVMDFVHGGAVR